MYEELVVSNISQMTQWCRSICSWLIGKNISKFICNEFCTGEAKKNYYKSYCGMPIVIKIIDVLAQNMVIIKMRLNKNAVQKSIVILYVTLE